MLEVSDPAVQSLPGRQGVDNVGDLHQVVVLHPDSGDLPGPPGQHRPESRLLHLHVQDCFAWGSPTRGIGIFFLLALCWFFMA